MMLLIEGPDMVGKTMLVAALAARLGEMGFEVPTDKFGLPESTRMVEECVKKGRVRPWVVADRCWVSEVVYGQVARGGPSVSVEEAGLITDAFARAGGLCCVVTADPGAYDLLVASHHHRGEAFSPQACRLVNGAYRTMLDNGVLGGYVVPIATSYEVVNGSDGFTYPSANRAFVDALAARYARVQFGMFGKPPPLEKKRAA